MTQSRCGQHSTTFVVRVACLASLSFACSPATVVTPERQTGGNGVTGGTTGANGSNVASGANGSGAGGSGAGTVITLPDAAAAGSDVSGPACAEEAYKAEAVPVDLLLLVDASGSMTERVSLGGASKWMVAQDALTSFVRDGRSAGLGVGLQFFPEVLPPQQAKACTSDAECGAGTACIGLGFCADAMGRPFAACRTGAIPYAQCPAQSTCIPAGICSGTGERCQTVGQTCPMNAGMCLPPRSTCTSPALNGGLGGVSQCGLAPYEKPSVAIGPLPQNEAALLASLGAKTPSGGTPMWPGVQGSLTQLRAHLEKNPGRRAVLVLATDGFPSCAPPGQAGDIPAIATLVGAAKMATPSIGTYVVGVFAPSETAQAQAQLDSVAMAGGTGQAFVITANNDLAMRLQEALNSIRGSALSCEFKIPMHSSELDFGSVKVRFTTNAGTREEVGHVSAMSSCDATRGGWYYDVDPAKGTPTSIHVCPASCEQFKKEGSGKVDLIFGCSTR